MKWRVGLAMMHAPLRMRPRLFPVVLMLCWLSSGGIAQQDDCGRIEVSLAEPSSWPFEGVYEYIGAGAGGTPVFKHTCHGMHLFYSTVVTPARWFLGANPTRNAGYAFLPQETASSPTLAPGLWSIWSGQGSDYTAQKNISIMCQADTACPMLMLWGPDTPKYLTGIYSKTNSFQNRRPVYKHKIDSLYLYHQSSGPSCQRWVVGPEEGKSLISMFTSSATFLPPSQGTTWTVIEPQQQREVSKVYVTCSNENFNTTDPADPIKTEPECGQRKLNGGSFPAALIFNGQNIDYPGKWPFTVSLYKHDGTHKCAGALIGPKWVLTAGHCATTASRWREYLVVMGTSHLDRVESTRQVRSITNILRHDQFVWTLTPFNLNYDIIILELDSDVEYTDYLQPACLPLQGEPLPFQDLALDSPYSDCWMMGWGITTPTDVSGGILQEQSVQLGDIRTCAPTKFTPDLAWAANTEAFCAYPANQAKICKGDSGGPLMCKKEGRWTIVGLASWTIVQCVNNNIPSVYTDVTQFVDWIKERLPE